MKTLFKYFLIIIFYFTSILSVQLSAQENLKIGLLIPMTGENEKIGQLIIKAVKLAINDIDNNNIEISELLNGLKLVTNYLEKNILIPNNISQPVQRTDFINLLK